MKRCEGFTLIELMVVLSVIALLIAVFLPVLGMARRTAIAIQCASDIRQVGLSAAFYLNDWHGRWPGYWGNAPGQGANLNFWNDRLVRDYRGNAVEPQGMGCPTMPATKNQRRLANPSDYHARASWSYYGTYAGRTNRLSTVRSGLQGGNYFSVWDLDQTTDWEPKINSSSDYWLFSDANHIRLNGLAHTEWQFFTVSTVRPLFPTADSTTHGAVALYHTGGSNIAFADGHVERWQAAERSRRIAVHEVMDPQIPTGRREVPLP